MKEHTSELAYLVGEKRAIEAQISDLEISLKAAKASLEELVTKRIPDLMMEMDQTSCKLTDGTVVSIRQFFNCHLLSTKKAQGLQWLSENGQAGSIKNVVTIKTSGGQEAQEAITLAQDAGFTYTHDVSIHHQTLNKTARELILEGIELPEDMFRIFTGSKAHIKETK